MKTRYVLKRKSLKFAPQRTWNEVEKTSDESLVVVRGFYTTKIPLESFVITLKKEEYSVLEEKVVGF